MVLCSSPGLGDLEGLAPRLEGLAPRLEGLARLEGLEPSPFTSSFTSAFTAATSRLNGLQRARA